MHRDNNVTTQLCYFRDRNSNWGFVAGTEYS